MGTASKIMMIAFAACFCSCAFKDSSGDKAKTARDGSSETLSRTDIKTEIVPIGGQLGSYALRFSWPQSRSIFITFVYDSRLQSNEREAVVEESVDGESRNSFDIPCPSSLRISPKLSITSKGVTKLATYSFDQICPIDFEVTSEVAGVGSFPRDLNGRLFLRNNAVLKLKSSQLKLNLIGLHVEGRATIESEFDPKATEPQVQIAAKQASGDLTILLKGYDGRDGRSGDERADASVEYQRLLEQDMPADGADGADGAEVTTNLPHPSSRLQTYPVTSCTAQPGNGGNGADATVAGLDGSNGENGSPSPRMLMIVDQASQLNLTVNVSPGRGGRAGAAGHGQRGGRGGKAGKRPQSCNAVTPGKAGADARPGNPGVQGLNGACGQIEISANLKSVMRVIDQHDFSKCAQDPNLIRIVP